MTPSLFGDDAPRPLNPIPVQRYCPGRARSMYPSPRAARPLPTTARAPKAPFAYYGSKSLIAGRYPRPDHRLIVEPFGGSASYAWLHRDDHGRPTVRVDRETLREEPLRSHG